MDDIIDISAEVQPNGVVRRPAITMPDVNLENAKKTMLFYQQNPEFLASPYTSRIANGHLSAASRIIGMNVQLEKLNADTSLAETKNKLAQTQAKYLGEIPGKYSAKYFVPDENGKVPAYQVEHLPEIQTLWEEHVFKPQQAAKLKDIQPKVFKLELASGEMVEGTYNPQTGMFKEHKPVTEIEQKAKDIKLKRLQATDTKYGEEIDHYQRELDAASASKDSLKSKEFTAKIQTATKQRARLKGQMDELSGNVSTSPPAGNTNLPTATNPKTGEKVVFKDGKWQTP